jgi:bifunctional DNA-binding transcriptional regulator/antitoxin component of YhaV-PrlF toxin-antitoxin module
MNNYSCPLMISETGRTTIPTALRRAAGIKAGEVVGVVESTGYISLMTRDALYERIWSNISEVDDLDDVEVARSVRDEDIRVSAENMNRRLNGEVDNDAVDALLAGLGV